MTPKLPILNAIQLLWLQKTITGQSTIFIRFYPNFCGRNIKYTANALMKNDPTIRTVAAAGKWLYPNVVALEDLRIERSKIVYSNMLIKRQNYGRLKQKFCLIALIFLRRFFRPLATRHGPISVIWLPVKFLVSLKELRMLSSLHGIGMIHLNAENPAESQIIIPAKERNEIDWDTANRLAEENRDFLDYIKLIRHFIKLVRYATMIGTNVKISCRIFAF